MTSAQLGGGSAGRSGVAVPPVRRRPVLTVVGGVGARGSRPPAPATARGDEPRRAGGRVLRVEGDGARAVGARCAGGQAWERPAAAGRPAPPVRLTRRGRRLVGVLVIATGVGLAALGATTVLDGGSDGLQLAGNSSVVVQPGDTLWSIALTVAPEEDTRGVVDAIVAANDLDGVGLVPGQVLRLP